MAGNLKPDGVNAEAQYVINSFSGYHGTPADLFNGINTTENYWYWYPYAAYLDITIKNKCNIWRLAPAIFDTQTYMWLFGQILRYENNQWVDVTSTLQQYCTLTNGWEITIPNLPAGRYKFTGAKDRIDGEWYLESLQRYLYLKNNEVFGMSNNVFTKLSDNWLALTDAEKKELFILTNYQTPTADDLATLGKFKVLIYAENDRQQTCTVTAAPHDQLIFPNGLINLESFEGIDKVTLASIISGSGSCKLLVTTDLATYQTYDFTAKTWQSIDHTNLAAVKSTGIDAVQLGNIDRTGWDALTTGKTGIGFAYLLAIEATTDKSAVDKLDLQVDMKGSWDKAVHGTDYKYGYPKNNLLRVQLLANGDYKINYQK